MYVNVKMHIIISEKETLKNYAFRQQDEKKNF